MADIDAELLERVTRWCAEAGRQTTVAEIRRALAGLGWGELLAARALLADPPPARPLGPFALADLARGAPPDVAAEREREGRYRSEEEAAPPEAVPTAPLAAPPPPPPRRGSRRAPRGRGVVIRRARDAPLTPPPPAPSLPVLDDLLRPEGRSVLERLVRVHGARRRALVAALAAGWRRDGGDPPGDEDLSRLLGHHGLSRAFERRERDDVLHAVRAAGGVRSAAAARLGLDPEGLEQALSRLGASAEVERIREERRADVRRRATIAERARLLLGDEARLRDLEVLAEIEGDLRARLPEHVRALQSSGAPLAVALSRTLGVTPAEARALCGRFGLDPGARAAKPRPAGAVRAPGPGPRPRSARGAPPARAGQPAPGPAQGPPQSARRPSTARGADPGRTRAPDPRPPRGRPRPGGRPPQAGPRPGERPPRGRSPRRPRQR